MINPSTSILLFLLLARLAFSVPLPEEVSKQHQQKKDTITPTRPTLNPDIPECPKAVAAAKAEAAENQKALEKRMEITESQRLFLNKYSVDPSRPIPADRLQTALDKMILDLSKDAFLTRQQGSGALEAMGALVLQSKAELKQVVPTLMKASQSRDPEVAMRSRRALDTLNQTLEPIGGKRRLTLKADDGSELSADEQLIPLINLVTKGERLVINNKEFMVDSITVEKPRPPSQPGSLPRGG